MLERAVPLYIQITRILRRELNDGVYPVASRMPDEMALSSRFGVSKDVIRKSMRQLAKDGLVKAIRSKGTFVCEKPEQAARNFVLLSYHGNLHLDSLRKGIAQCMEPADNLVLKDNPLDDLAAEAELLQTLNFPDLKALIAAPVYQAERDNSAIYTQILRRGIPTLIVDHSLPNVGADEISFDEYRATAKLMKEALLRAEAKHLKIIMLCVNGNNERIALLRRQAMLDVFGEFGGISPLRKVIEFEWPGYDYRANAMRMLEACGSEDLENSAIVCPTTVYAWEFLKLLRERGDGEAVRQFSGIGDILRGDEDFNRRLYAHYRLFDEFEPLIAEVLKTRLSGGSAPGVPIRHSLGFKEMDYRQIVEYFTSRMG